MNAVTDIGPDADLRPKYSTSMIDGQPELMANPDAIIDMVRTSSSPKAKAFYRRYRLVKAQMAAEALTPQELRAKALLRTLEESGFRIQNIGGEMG